MVSLLGDNKLAEGGLSMVAARKLRMAHAATWGRKRSCPAHNRLRNLTAVFQLEYKNRVNVVLFSQASEQATADLVNQYKLNTMVVVDVTGTLAQTYQARATPFAYRLNKNGRVQQRGIVNDRDGLEALLEAASPDDAVLDLPPSPTSPPTVS